MMYLLDNGSTINAVTPELVKVCSLDICPLSDLVDGTLSINSFDRLFSQPLGYIIIRAQVEGVQGYDEDKWPWAFQIQLIFYPGCWSFWAHWPSTES